MVHYGKGISRIWMNRQTERRTGVYVYGEMWGRTRGRKGIEIEELIELSISLQPGDRGGRKLKYNEQFSASEMRRILRNTQWKDRCFQNTSLLRNRWEVIFSSQTEVFILNVEAGKLSSEKVTVCCHCSNRTFRFAFHNILLQQRAKDLNW